MDLSIHVYIVVPSNISRYQNIDLGSNHIGKGIDEDGIWGRSKDRNLGDPSEML